MTTAPNRALLLVLPIALALLLIALAVVQYRWVGELSANERRRMEASLRSSLDSMARQMNDELARAADAVQIDAVALEALDGRGIAAKWNLWSDSALAPGIIDEVHLVRLDGDEPKLYRLERATGQLEPASWGNDLRTVREAIETDRRRGSLEQRRWLETESSAIVSSIVEMPVITTGTSLDVADIVRQIQTAPRVRLRGYLIAGVDLGVLQQTFMPELVARYVPDDDYRIALVRRSDGRPLYISAGGSIDSPDAVAGVLPDAALPMVVPTTGGTQSEPPPYSLRSGSVSVLSARGISISTSVTDLPRWELRAVHRAGSVDAAVARMQRRNLVVGSSILLVLAAGIGFAFLHVRRADALARQQMEFVSVMSHELRTPIAIVSAAADNLSSGVVNSREREREYGDAIGRETARLTAMVEQVLEFARTRGRSAYSREEVDLRVVAHDSVEALRSLANAKGGSIDLCPGDSPVLVRGDSEALGRAVRNLISNAIKHSEDSPRITVTTAATQRDATLQVADRGPGISVAERARLTEPFFRGSRAVDQQIPGSGLGLAIVERIVDAHNGRLSIGTTDGVGSEFTICLRRLTR